VGAQSTVSTVPAQLVRAPAGFGLYFRITVTNAAASLPSLLPGGVLPSIPPANISGPGGTVYAFKFVDLEAETDPNGGGPYVRYTDDGQTAPTATLGYVVPGQPSFVRIPCDPQDVKLISTGADVKVQVKLGIMGLTTGGN
jgi:hypothetical protein